MVDYDRRREEIAEKAKEVFAKRGYRRTKLADISEKCGMARTTLYQYFRNKEEIFYYTAIDAFEEIEAEVKVIVEDDSLSFIEKLKKLTFELANECEYSYIFILLVEVWVILNKENSEFVEKINIYVEDLKDTINKIIIDGIKAKELKPVDSKSMADTLFAFIQTSIIQPSSYDNISIQNRISSINILIDGLKA